MPDKDIKTIKDSAEEVKGIVSDDHITEKEKSALAKIGSKLSDLAHALEEKTRYTSLLELFNIDKLDIITELDKRKVEDITRFETYISSQKELYGLEENDLAIIIVRDMVDSYRTNMISYKRKSRKEVENILKEAYDAQQRNLGRLIK